MKTLPITLTCLLFTGLYSCKSDLEKNDLGTNEVSLTSIVQVQGHRGDRGNFPENSIPAFISAVKKGVDVLELDVVISKDKQVVVSHEPYMSSLFVNNPSGDSIKKTDERSYNLYEMNYDSIRRFDVGSRGNFLFPDQQKIKTYKPLLSEVIDSVETFIAAEGLPPVKYNIELKSVEADYGKYQPQPEEFGNLVMEIIEEKGISDKIYIQSFDPNILNLMNEEYPETNLAYLVYREGIDQNLSVLQFIPEIYSPNFNQVIDEQFVDSINYMEMELIPWTVNEKEDIRKMIDLNVDGIISDYPEKVIEMRKNVD
ncbi:glycerophosphodiester phosphodiesterase family protein [Gillisia sp. CAL575]|uniref:glycerophosphodiester phosphodiesterase family protein n=1 Tax=Gillisia sp. CAL575 TaxID=985255 RepID=UPI0003A3456C|nr:glycerophosphodiester phosphodiesterase family protein [Gillisia sp. CAL575]